MIPPLTTGVSLATNGFCALHPTSLQATCFFFQIGLNAENNRQFFLEIEKLLKTQNYAKNALVWNPLRASLKKRLFA